jgi:hypothetical protein
MFQKKLAISLAILLLLAIPSSAQAIQWTYLQDYVQSFYISSTGSASVYASTLGQTSASKVDVKAYLQKYENGSWTNIKSWDASANSYLVELDKTYYVAHGTYRLYTIHTAYSSGGVPEDCSVTSPNIVY